MNMAHIRVLFERLSEEENVHLLNQNDATYRKQQDGAAATDESVVLRLFVEVQRNFDAKNVLLANFSLHLLAACS